MGTKRAYAVVTGLAILAALLVVAGARSGQSVVVASPAEMQEDRLAHIVLTFQGLEQPVPIAYHSLNEGSLGGKVDPFSLKIAGLTLNVHKAHLADDSRTIVVEAATITLPEALGGATGEPFGGFFVTPEGLRPASASEAKTAHLASYCGPVCQDPTCVPIKLPPFMVDNVFITYPIQACLCQNADESYRVEGEGGFFLPNISNPSPGGGYDIWVKFSLDWPNLKVHWVCFEGTAEPGIPIGDTGFFLTRLEGEVILEPEIEVRLEGTIESGYDLMVCNLLWGELSLWVKMALPYEIQLEGTVNVCLWQVARAVLTLYQDWGLVGQGNLDAGVCHGEVDLHVWKEGTVFHFAGSGRLECTFEKGMFNPTGWPSIPGVPDLPPTDITVITDCEMGNFCRACEDGQCIDVAFQLTCGIALDVDLPDWLVEPGAIVGRCTFPFTGGLPTCRTNLYPCLLTDQATVTQQAKTAGVGLDSTHLVDLPMCQTDLAVVSLTWARGRPQVSLVDPSGWEIVPGDMYPDVMSTASVTGTALYLRKPEPGSWQAQITNLSGDEEYSLAVFCLNELPTVTIEILDTGSFTTSVPISYTVSDTNDEVTLALYYDRDNRGRDGKLITDCLPEGTGVYNWDVSEVGSGSYYVYGRVDDGKNLAVYTYINRGCDSR
jgi:hypothetical protein